MHDQQPRPAPPARLSTGIPGLDAVSCGGLLEGGFYILEGAPGTGKTILANQLCFHQARQGRKVAYLTLLAEAHDRMLAHLDGLAFTDRRLLPDPLAYASAYPVLEEEGLAGLTALVRETLRQRKATLLVLDGLYVARERSESERAFRRFVYELQGEAALRNVTFLLLSNSPEHTRRPEHTMVDGLIQLADERHGMRAVRTLQIAKLRGSGYRRGRHVFRIREDGIVLYPRLETLAGDAAHENLPPGRLSTGILALDRMLQGGVPARSTTLLLGPSGSGKTTLGLLFLAAASAREPGLFFSCYESMTDLALKARSVGIAVDRLLGEGALRIVWHPPYESSPDEMAYRLLEALDATGARRLVVDGLGPFRQTATHPDRLGTFFTALGVELRRRGVTTFCAAEARATLDPQALPLDELSAVAENVLLLRLGEERGRLARSLGIVKVRQSGFDPAIVPFAITDQGVALGRPGGGADPRAP